MARDLKEDFFRLDGAWASFELMSIRKREDYLKPFHVLRCKIDVLVAGGTRVVKRTSAMPKTKVERTKEEVA